MKILHGTWIPDPNPGFVQTGAFYLWIETDQNKGGRYLTQKSLCNCLVEELGFPLPQNYNIAKDISSNAFTLPTANGRPLPSLELARYLEIEIPTRFEWQTWEIDCYRVGHYFKGSQSYAGLSTFIPQLKELHFIAHYQLADVQLGSDLLFWFHYTQAFRNAGALSRTYASYLWCWLCRSAKSTAFRNAKSAASIR